MTLCLAKPKWIWFDEEEKNGGNFNDEVFARENGKNNENLRKYCDPPAPFCLRKKQ
jgi:hypothetical protein